MNYNKHEVISNKKFEEKINKIVSESLDKVRLRNKVQINENKLQINEMLVSKDTVENHTYNTNEVNNITKNNFYTSYKTNKTKNIYQHMRTDIDHIISLMKRYTTSNSNEELDEQDEAPAAAPAAGGGGGGSTTNTGRKWETGLTRGKANKLGLAGEKWETGLNRGHANPVP